MPKLRPMILGYFELTTPVKPVATDPMPPRIMDILRHPSREVAKCEAERICHEAPLLAHPDPTTVNLAACFLELLHRMEGLEK